MSKVIINADDFGYSRAVNFGVIDAHQLGILTSATIMANMPGFEHAIALAKANPKLGVGVHMTLTCGKPLLDVPSLCENGQFKQLSFYKQAFVIDEEELYQEWRAQILKVIQAGIFITHLDSHHHAHAFGNNLKVAIRLATEFNVPLRRVVPLPNTVMQTDYFEDQFDGVGYDDGSLAFKTMLETQLEKLLEKIEHHQVVEIMCHPAYLDCGIYEHSSFALPRMKQVEFLIHSSFANTLKQHETIELCHYNILKEI